MGQNKHNSGKKTRTERVSYCFTRYSRNGFSCYPPHTQKWYKDLKYQNRIRSKTPKTSEE